MLSKDSLKKKTMLNRDALYIWFNFVFFLTLCDCGQLVDELYKQPGFLGTNNYHHHNVFQLARVTVHIIIIAIMPNVDIGREWRLR